VKGNKLQGRVWLFEKVDMEFKDEEREREKKNMVTRDLQK
jgi:hypothetical protein